MALGTQKLSKYQQKEHRYGWKHTCVGERQS